MQPFPITSFVCPNLVGRAREREAVRRYLVAPGPPGFLVAGETGVGKSRLVREGAAEAEALGFLALWGRCFETDRVVPYAPVVEVLRTLFADRPSEELLRPLGSLADDLVKLVPHLVSPALTAGTEPPTEPGLGKQRLFQALVELLHYIARTQPVLLIIEDLHWSDDATLEFLLHLMRRAGSRSVFIIMTYRSEEVHPRLVDFLAAADRERLSEEMALQPFTAAETEAMLRAIFCQETPIRREVLDPIYALTEGNPFFIEEVLKSLVTSEGPVWAREWLGGKAIDTIQIPRSISHAVQRRLEQLSAGASRLATVAAVAGRHFDADLLKAVTQQEEGTLLALIRELMAAQLVVEESPDVFAFRHALTRQAVYTQLLGREREAYHLRVLEALENLRGAADLHLSDLAYHAYRSRAWARALEYAFHAGQRARALYAPLAAVEHFTCALEAAQASAVSPPPALYRQRGQVYETLGQFELARADLEASLGMARAGGDQRAEWETIMDLGMLWAGHEYRQTGQYYRQALDLATRMGDRSLLARSLNRVGNWHLNVGRPRQALRYHRRALETFHQLDDQQGVVETLDLLGMTSYLGGDMVNGWGYYGEAVARFTALDDRRGLVSSLSTRYGLNNAYHGSVVAIADVDPEESMRECLRALDIARSIGWRSGEAYAMVNLALVLGTQGRYGQAFEMLSGSYQIASDMGHRQWQCRASTILGTIYLDTMAYPRAIACLVEALDLAREFGAVFWLHTAAGRLASAYIQQARLEDAASLLRDYDVGDGDYTVGTRILLQSRAELALAQRDAGRALEIIEALLDSASSTEDARPYGLLLLRGQAYTVLAQHAQAVEALEAAKDTAARHNLMPGLWRVHVHLARAYRAAGRRADARRETAAARVIIDQLAAGLPDGGVRETFLQETRRRVLPVPADPSPRRERSPGGLTERERDVARLIAQGMTNRQIAQALVIGERTVESHVSNIMSKLGFNARAGIISWAFEKGLVDDPP